MRRVATGRPTLVLLALACLTQGLPAQSWRTVDAVRQSRTVDTLRVRVNYTVGALRIAAGGDTNLYRARLRYDANRFEPVREFDESSGTLRIGVRGDDDLPLRIGGGKEQGTLTLGLAPSRPLDLELDLGATDATLDLSGLPVSRLAIASGASELTISFATANPVAMRELTIDAGVARVVGEGIGNANAERVRVSGAVGSVDLDMSGRWSGTRNLQVSVTFGAAKVRVPRGVGVRVKHSRVLGTFEARGFTKRGDEYVSEGWDAAEQRLLIDARTTFGTLDVRWIEE
ncbi:MAG TPA: hypothetical protein VK922_18825 [Gemmatimonadaceae bacterium]|nr:hypothetical protein [Gemmatimonadaceae bacterium]